MNKLLLGTSTLLAITLAMPIEAKQIEAPYAKMKKQIDIMSNIIETAMDSSRSNRSRGASVNGVYLQNQGIVFEIDNMRYRKFDHFNVELSSLDLPPMAPIAPIAPIVIDGQEISVIDEEQIEQAAQAYEQVIEAFREQSEHARQLREEQRELAYEIRNLSRRKRDLEFEQRHARDDEDQADAQKDLKEVDDRLSSLRQRSDKLNQRAEKEEKSLKEQKQQRQAKAAKARKSYYQDLDNTIAQTLCDYGAGLRQLAKTEHVTFVIDLGNKNEQGADKKIHTFKKKDIISCVLEDKTPQQLMNDAQSYYF